MKVRLLWLLCIAVAIASCKKKPLPVSSATPVTGTSGKEVTIQIDHKVGTQSLQLDKDKWYITDNNDSISFTRFSYYLSNFVFIDEQNKEHKIDESYFLIKESEQVSKKLVLNKLHNGKYRKMRFLIGVDSLRNTSGAQTGALDPTNGMFWDWNTGYIMAAIEGRSPQSSTNNYVFFHIAGFAGENKVQREVTIDFGKAVEIGEKSINMHITADVLEVFKTPTTIDLSKMSNVLSEGPNAKMMADNYMDMFTLDHIEEH